MGCSDRADTEDSGKPLDDIVGLSRPLQSKVGELDLLVDDNQGRKQGDDLVEKQARELDSHDPLDEVLRATARDPVPLAAYQGTDQVDVLSSCEDKGPTSGQPGSDVSLFVREAMGGSESLVQASFGQGPGVVAVGLDLAGAMGIHGREVRIGHYNLMTELLKATRDPLAICRCLDENAGSRSVAKGPGKEPALGGNPSLTGTR